MLRHVATKHATRIIVRVCENAYAVKDANTYAWPYFSAQTV